MQPILNGWADYWNWDGNGYKRDVLRRSEMVYVNGLPPVELAQGELSAAGTFYADEGRSRIFMRPPTGVSLPSATVEVGVRLTAVAVNGRNNVTLRNLAVMRNRGAVQQGAALQATNLRISRARRRSHPVCRSDRSRHRRHRRTPDSRLKISDNGIVGHNDYRSRNALVQGVEVARNNWRGWPAELRGFGTVYKWAEARDVTIRQSRFIDNLGHGIWFDSDNQRILIENNFVARNGNGGIGRGIFLELNGGPITVQRNRICDNGEAGIADGRSNNVTVLNNEIFNNAYYHPRIHRQQHSGDDSRRGGRRDVRGQFVQLDDQP